MAPKGDTIKERLMRVEILLNNHLKHHEIWFKCVIAPMAVGIIAIVIKLYLM